MGKRGQSARRWHGDLLCQQEAALSPPRTWGHNGGRRGSEERPGTWMPQGSRERSEPAGVLGAWLTLEPGSAPGRAP